jgi:hypothetical protein
MGDPFETFLQDFSPSIQEISMQLRTTIQEAAPEAKEVFSEDLRHLSYSYRENTAEPVLLLAAKKDFVLLVFKQCKRLRDPEGLLGNMGKPIGFMTLRTMEDANRPALKELIKSAWSSTIEQPA